MTGIYTRTRRGFSVAWRNSATSLGRAAIVGCLATLCAGNAISQDPGFIVVQSTTSTESSGLFDYLLPSFEKETGIDVRVVAVGTGQAIKNAENGDGDVLFVHAKAAEEAFVASGHGVSRHDVMYNDFVIAGPGSDPAKVRGMTDVVAALETIAQSRSRFVSRGDDSGTHKAELGLWDVSGVVPSRSSGDWYVEAGSGMGATLNMAAAMGGYVLTDRGTWISFQNKGDLEVLVEGDPRLFNQYGIILVNSAMHPEVRSEDGQAFVDWILSEKGQSAIGTYRIDGQQLFFPNAAK